MERKGISSSLALLASIMVLTAQICINLAFTEVMIEEVMGKAKEVIESRDYGQVILIASNETSFVVVNRRDRDVLVSGLSLCYPNGSMVDVEVEWHIPRMSISKYQVPQSLRDCVAVILKVEGTCEVVLPVYRAQL